MTPIPSPSFSLTLRLVVIPDATMIGRVTTAVGQAGATVTALDVAESSPEGLVVDVTCQAGSAEHAETVRDVLAALDGVQVRSMSDRTFLLHLGGKIEMRSKLALRTRDELSMAYTPGVARVCEAIAARPEDARRLTIKRNSVAVVTDGSAVLGLGNLGPYAAMPVMEGKAALFKRFGEVDAWPICLDSQDTDEIVRAVEMIAPGFGGINLEDIAAPRCFEIERRLRESLDIPVFHDDQHGTAIAVLAALTNALRYVDKAMTTCKVVVCGAGAAGTAIIKLLLEQGVGEVLACDRPGILHKSMPHLTPEWHWLAERTNHEDLRGTLADALVGADVFIGVSAPGLLTGAEIARMAPRAIVFAMANPQPEVDPAEAREAGASIVATGRSDHANQINNVLVFPGFFRGLLDVGAHKITLAMELAAAEAIASTVRLEQLNASFIVPSVFDPSVAPAVARAVRSAAGGSWPAAHHHVLAETHG